MWYNRVANDLNDIPAALAFYESELSDARNETKIIGSLEKNAQELSGVMAFRFGQLQELEAILKHLNIRYDKMRSTHYRKYLEHYNKVLTDRSIEKYIDGEDDIVTMNTLINEVSLVRNKYLALMKGLDTKQYQLSNIVKLRIVGLETTVLDHGRLGS